MTGRISATTAFVALIAGLTLAACGAETQVAGGGSTTVSPSNPDQSSTASTPSESAGDATGGLTTADQLAQAAAQDLAKRTGLPDDQITVSRNDAVTWPDGSLGCPQGGMAYVSMLSPGQLIVLEAGGKTYEYHAGRQMAPFLCENPQPPLPAN